MAAPLAPAGGTVSVLVRGEGADAPVSRCTLKAHHLRSKPVRFLVRAYCKSAAALDPEACVVTLASGATFGVSHSLKAFELDSLRAFD